MYPAGTVTERDRGAAGITADAVSASRADAMDAIVVAFKRHAASGMAKYMQVARAILDVVEDNDLRPDDQVPPEDLLTSSLGVSLGTIRRALARLASDGVVSRRHGYGTFIASHSRALGDNWHFRFIANDREGYLPVYSRVRSRTKIEVPGNWTRALGPDPKGYIRLERTFDVDGRFSCFSEFYLQASSFAPLLTTPISDLESINLKMILDRQFGKPTISARQVGRISALPDRACNMLSVPLKSIGQTLEITAYTLSNVPLSYHAIYIPPNNCALDLTQIQAGPKPKGTID